MLTKKGVFINMNENEIKVYGAMWCGDCRRSKKFLDSQKIAYTWIDVEQDDTARETMQTYNGGRQSIPTIVFADGTVLVEPSNAELGQKLGLSSVR